MVIIKLQHGNHGFQMLEVHALDRVNELGCHVVLSGNISILYNASGAF